MDLERQANGACEVLVSRLLQRLGRSGTKSKVISLRDFLIDLASLCFSTDDPKIKELRAQARRRLYPVPEPSLSPGGTSTGAEKELARERLDKLDTTGLTPFSSFLLTRLVAN